MNQYFVVATAIIVKDSKFLIAQRSAEEEKFPGRWTVPGGTLEPEDYKTTEPNPAGLWYNVIEKLLAREVMGEVNVSIRNIRYIVSLTYSKSKGPALCLSFMADYTGGEARPSSVSEVQACRWVTLEEAEQYDLIEGIYEELLMADDILKGKQVQPWHVYEAKRRKSI